MSAILAALKGLIEGRELARAAVEEAVVSLLDGEASEIEAAAFLTALAVRGETLDELEGVIRAVRSRMISFHLPDDRPAIDTCGTGGDHSRTLNLSTGSAIIARACGARVVKHGNRAASSRSGSTDVLEALGIATDLDPDSARRCLDQIGIAYLHAPTFHPGLKRLAPIRRQLPFRTLFNLVGPLANPASPAFQVVGCPDLARAFLVVGVLAKLDHIKRAVVVTGADGLDEVSLSGPTHAWLVEEGTIRPMTLDPSQFRLPITSHTEIQVESAQESAQRLRRVFAGERGPARDYLVANTAVALWTLGANTLMIAARTAEEALDSGAAARVADRWAELCPARPTHLA